MTKTRTEHIREGTFRQDRHGKKTGDLIIVSEVPELSEIQSRSEKEIFDTICELLLKRKLLFEEDIPVISAFAFALWRAELARKQIRKEGITTSHTNKANNQNIVPHPAMKILENCENAILKYSAKLGFNPIDKAKVVLPTKDKSKPKFNLE